MRNLRTIDEAAFASRMECSGTRGASAPAIEDRRAGEITISFGSNTNQAGQFARSVPNFVLKGRFADLVELDCKRANKVPGSRRDDPALVAPLIRW